MRFLMLVCLSMTACDVEKPFIPQMMPAHQYKDFNWALSRIAELRLLCGDHVPWEARATPHNVEFTCRNPDLLVAYHRVPPGKILGSKSAVASAGKLGTLGVTSVGVKE
jgi:hypothetical protein